VPRSDRDNGSDPIELPRPKRTLLQRFALWLQHAKALKGWIEEARGRSAALDATFETIENDSRIGGGMLAGALSYRLFVFALPLAFFIVSGLGLLESTIGIHPNVVTNSVGLAGVVTKQIAAATKETSDWWVALTSFFVLAYATRVLFRAVAIVHSLAFEGSAASVKVPARRLGIFAAALVGQIGLIAGIGAVDHQSAVGGLLTLVVFVAALAGIWLIVSLQMPHANARWVDLIPGSLLYAIGLIGVTLWNVLMLGHLIDSKTTTYGALGTAATLLLAFFLVGRVIVGAAVLNATLYGRRTRSPSTTPSLLPAGRAEPHAKV
jgi:uncharacterized BrkB/YihY/UPF0761 family membrane protein